MGGVIRVRQELLTESIRHGSAGMREDDEEGCYECVVCFCTFGGSDVELACLLDEAMDMNPAVIVGEEREPGKDSDCVVDLIFGTEDARVE